MWRSTDSTAGRFGPTAPNPEEDRQALVQAVAPALRGLLADGDVLKIVVEDNDRSGRPAVFQNLIEAPEARDEIPLKPLVRCE